MCFFRFHPVSKNRAGFQCRARTPGEASSTQDTPGFQQSLILFCNADKPNIYKHIYLDLHLLFHYWLQSSSRVNPLLWSPFLHLGMYPFILCRVEILCTYYFNEIICFPCLMHKTRNLFSSFDFDTFSSLAPNIQ